MELSALVNVDDTIGWRLPMPHCIVQESLDSVEDDLEYAETTTQSLSGQQVSFSCYLSLLGCAQLLNVRNNLQCRVSDSGYMLRFFF